ncbi:TldD/PmbA family protein [Fusibacter sp. 3D3]|uniref:TldD/PmbA family protein n=1 Tax=Fusibacter sp. 3D3 TaxID=1048380 RepID=UPI0008538676|nr:TldD/PmbA family protein [Fusibacter sp. 3D3]GAU76273.1 TldD protein [Fusibacter sp. 3D3]
MIPLKSYEKALLNLPSWIKEAEIDAENHEQVSYTAKGGAVTSTNSSGLTALYVRATGEKTGYVYTENLSEDGESVIKRAYENGLYIEKSDADRLNDKQTAYVANKAESKVSDLPEIDLNVIKESVLRFDGTVSKLPNLVDYSVAICIDNFRSRLLNSKGVDISSAYQVWHYAVNLTCSYMGKEYDGKYEGNVASFEWMDFNTAVEKAHQMILDQRIEGQLASGEHQVLLDSQVVINIMTTAWQMFSGLKYFESSSALSGKLGTDISTSELSIIDTNEHTDAGYKYTFDCEGTLSQTHKLIDKGRFIGLLHNLKSAESMDMAPTGNAGRVALLTGSIPTDIIVTPKIIYIEPSEKSKELLLNTMNKGVYLTNSSDVFHSIDISSGDFSIPCSGRLVEEGMATQAIRDLTLNGNLIDLFDQITAVGNDLKIEAFLLKSYCIGAPSVLVNRLNISCK